VREGEVGARLVVLSNNSFLFEEVGETELVLRGAAIGLAVFGHILLEFEVIVGLEGGGDAGEGSKGEISHKFFKLIEKV